MTDPTGRLRDALADRYRIARELGQGGMATVYLAEDLKHDRKVAIKVLKPELAAVLGAERFVIEIKTTAALSHPHILPLFDSGTADGFLFYVMPYIDGETLRAKLDRETQLGVDEAVKLACEVADALHYAHEHGVIHRDIKPENILLANGRPMVADFGIALAVSAAAGGRMTETGLSLGTPHYMSPEQATAEKEISRRSDVYSLASVLYEMLAGSPPHTGSSAQQIIMKIITEAAAPVTSFRKSVPAHVAAAVATGLEKLPADRFATAAAFAQALTDRGYTNPTMAFVAGARRDARPSRRSVAVVAVLLAVASAAAVAGWMREAPPGLVHRFEVLLANSTPDFAIPILAPTGGRLAYADLEGAMQLREPDALESRPILGSESSWSPVFSPDGQSMAVNSGEPGPLQILPLDGGSPRTVVPALTYARGMDWTRDGWIYYLGGPEYGRDLMRVRAAGGEPEFVARPDSTSDVFQYMHPQVLPSGRILLTVLLKNGDQKVAVLDPKRGTLSTLADGIYSRYAPTGHLLVASSEGVLRAARFDHAKGDLQGGFTVVAEGLAILYFTGSGPFAITDDGTLAYQRATSPNRVVRVSRTGGAESVVDADWSGFFRSVALSPDGSRLAVGVDRAGRTELWVRALESGAMTRLSSGGVWNYRPSWSPDGRDLLFTSDQLGKITVFRVRADGSSPPVPLLRVAPSVDEVLFSRDGAWLIYRAGSGGGRDIFARRTAGDSTDIPIVASPAEEFSPTISPDGRWLAYASEETGRTEVYVRPFPDAGAAKFTVSRNGGSEPLWSPAGGELFFRDANDDLIAVSVAPGDAFRVTASRTLFSARGYRSDNRHRNYTVTADGQTFYFIKTTDVLTTSIRVIVTLNWFEELRRLAGR